MISFTSGIHHKGRYFFCGPFRSMISALDMKRGVIAYHIVFIGVGLMTQSAEQCRDIEIRIRLTS